VVCGLIGWTLLSHRSLPSGSGERARLEGVTLPPLPGYRWNDHQKTLVLAIRKGCHYCDSSLPFYKQLSGLEKNNTLHAHLLAVMPDDPAAGTADLRSGGVLVEAIFKQPLSSIQVSGTPTLFLVDAKGSIEHSWVGELTPQGEKDVISTLEK
jgi:thioredoxin-related protein